MAFVNEYISASDIKKYDIENISKRFIVGGVIPCQWTIDRERDIYLRIVARGREAFSHESTWTLYWKGELLVIELDLVGGSGDRGQPGWSHWRLRRMALPHHLENRREEILLDLKEALTAYKDGGVFSANTTYAVTLDL